MGEEKEKKDYFIPLREIKKCDYWEKCSSYPKKCKECKLNPELEQEVNRMPNLGRNMGLPGFKDDKPFPFEKKGGHGLF